MIPSSGYGDRINLENAPGRTKLRDGDVGFPSVFCDYH